MKKGFKRTVPLTEFGKKPGAPETGMFAFKRLDREGRMADERFEAKRAVYIRGFILHGKFKLLHFPLHPAGRQEPVSTLKPWSPAA